MSLKDKYQDVLDLGQELGVKNGDVREEGGKLHISGVATYRLDMEMLWDKIKTHAGWEQEVQADITVENTEIFGIYTVKSGDTLSKVAKQLFGNANLYMKIFELNTDQLKNPDMIKVGQKLKLPNP